MPTTRAYTTYEGYKDYTSEDLLNDMYPLEGDGRAVTPGPGVGDRCYTPMIDGGHRSPSPARPASKTRLLGRPTSRYDVSVQDYPMELTEAKRRPQPQATQRDYAIPGYTPRPTSPVARLLDRYPSSPCMGGAPQQMMPGNEMDPITRQYYNRLWKTQSPPSSINLNRQGRAGGVWRHVRACVANTGTQLAFIDGTVKQEDNVFFPTYKQRLPSRSARQFPAYATTRPHQQRPLAASARGYNSKFNARAKEGFKYWYQEPKPIDLRGETTRIRARMVGNGY